MTDYIFKTSANVSSDLDELYDASSVLLLAEAKNQLTIELSKEDEYL